MRGTFKRGAPSAADLLTTSSYKLGRTKQTQSEPDDMSKRMAEINNLLDNPSMLQDGVAKGFGDMADHAPGTTIAAQIGLTKRLGILKAAMPPKDPFPALIKQKQPINQAHRQKFTQALEMADHPIGTMFSHLDSGTLTKELVSLGDAMAPESMQHARTVLTNELLDNPDRKLTLLQQEGLSTFLGAPVTPEFSQAFAQYMLSTSSMPAKSANMAQQAADSGRAKGTDNMKTAQRAALPGQELDQEA